MDQYVAPATTFPAPPANPARLSRAEKQARLARALETRPSEKPFRLFAFGSLMWNPECRVADRRVGVLRGYQRRFQIWSTRARGTTERPGLGLCLTADVGGACRGLVLDLDERRLEEDLVALWDREQNSGVYDARWMAVETDAGLVQALAFVAVPEHPHFVGPMPLDDMARIMAVARGSYGTNRDYLRNLLAELEILGVDDPELRMLDAKIRDLAEG